MPWKTPTLDELRALNRDNITAKLRSGPMIPNSVLRVMADGSAGLAYLTMLYINWLALQVMPDTAETEWLDRFGTIWLGGRKAATFATAIATVSGIAGIAVPAGTEFSGSNADGDVLFQSTEQIEIGSLPSPVNLLALTPGATSLVPRTALSLTAAISGVSGITIATIADGINEETDDELRARVLDRIRQPPMGGDQTDYEQWATKVPGVTRAWCFPLEMGIGTVTVRFMCDDTRATSDGIPEVGDVARVKAYLDTVRPVAVKDYFVEAPIPYPLTLIISDLEDDNPSVRAAIGTSVRTMLHQRAVPGGTVYASWMSEAISAAVGEDHHTLTFANTPMPAPGYMPVVGSIVYV